MDGFAPIHIADVEISEPLPVIEAPASNQSEAFVLFRLHGVPVGQMRLPLESGKIVPDRYLPLAWAEMHTEIEGHLQEDGLPLPTALPVSGLAFSEPPGCETELHEFRSKAPAASVIVCTKNRPESVRRLLPHLLQQDYPEFEVVIVDNAPSDDRLPRLLESSFGGEPCVRYVLESRPGLSVARNRGLHEARHDYVAYIDDDEVPDDRWLLSTMRAFFSEPKVGAVTGPILPLTLDTPAQVWFEEFGGHSKGRGLRRAVFDVESHKTQSPLFPSPPFGAGGNMSFVREVLISVGGFDESMGSGTPVFGAEDTSAIYDVMRAGWTVVYEPQALVRHEHYRTVEAFLRQWYGYGVGITAFYARALTKDPQVFWQVLKMIPKALSLVLFRRSGRERNEGRALPPGARRAELRGMLAGPVAYARSRFRRYQA